MRHTKRIGMGILFATVFCAIFVVFANTSRAADVTADTPRHVVDANGIQAQIDQQAGRADADRQAIRLMLQREDVRRMAGTAGLDLERANAAAALLSRAQLESMAAQARVVNSDLAGGDGSVVISTTAIIIILLVLLLLAS